MTSSPSAGDVADGAHASDLPEQQRVRRAKRAHMYETGADPYPASVPRTHSLSEVRDTYDPAELGPDVRTGDEVAVTGRAIFVRDTGQLVFVRLRSGDAELQCMVSRAGVGSESLAAFKALVDIGDHLSVAGEVVTSRRGELSVQASSWSMAAKTLRPLPVEHKPLSEETRARMRYADLIVRPAAREMVLTRAAVLRAVRRVLDERGFVEVETPVLQYVHGGAAARPFRTHLQAFDQDMTLRIALELYLKRCVVGGIERVYEIGRTFRNEGLDSTHSPEFTMLEAYQAYGDHSTMATLTRDLVVAAARETGHTVVPDGHGGEIDLDTEWQTLSLLNAVSAAVGTEITVETSADALRTVAERTGVELRPDWGADEIVVELYEQLVERTLLVPTFVTDYPASVRPLARSHRSKPGLAESWDLVIGGVELTTAYTELTDPVVQRDRLLEQASLAAQGDSHAMQLDEDFLRALEFGLPPTGGMGLGIDRLIRLLTGAGLREAILFPLVRPEAGAATLS
jgi:lysyl-tRNA synthetase class 2